MNYTIDDIVIGLRFSLIQNQREYWYKITSVDLKSRHASSDAWEETDPNGKPSSRGIGWSIDGVGGLLFWLNMSPEEKEHRRKIGSWYTGTIEGKKSQSDNHDWQTAYSKNRDKIFKELFGAQ